VPGKLDAKMTKAANALNSEQVSGSQARVSKRVVGCNSRAEERRGFCGVEFVRNGSDAARFGEHHFGVPSIHGYSCEHGVLAIHRVSAPTRFANAIFAGDEADTDTLADLSSGIL
jgi:hypothetical protein